MILINATNMCEVIDKDLTNFIHNIIVLIKIGLPILLIVFGMLDFTKAMMAGKEDEMKKGQKLFVKRLIAGVVVFLMISITQFVISLADGSDSEVWQCALAIMNGEAGTHYSNSGVEEEYKNSEYYENVQIVYYDPVNGSLCNESEYVFGNSITGYAATQEQLETYDSSVRTSCLKWYAYSKNNNGTVNMILDHNITEETLWIDSDDIECILPQSAKNISKDIPTYIYDQYGLKYDKEMNFPSESNCNYSGSGTIYHTNSVGPLSVLYDLSFYTENWSDSLIRTDGYALNTKNNSNEKIRYTIDYTKYKARLISVEEIYLILGKKGTPNLSENLYFDGSNLISNINIEKVKKYSWLFNNTAGCKSMGCDDEDSLTNGYWTSTPTTNIKENAIYVGSFGGIGQTSINQNNTIGIRPVITIDSIK